MLDVRQNFPKRVLCGSRESAVCVCVRREQGKEYPEHPLSLAPGARFATQSLFDAHGYRDSFWNDGANIHTSASDATRHVHTGLHRCTNVRTATAILKARTWATFEFCVFQRPCRSCARKQIHAQTSTNMRVVSKCARSSRQMGSSPPGAPLLEDQVDMKRRVTNANSHPPHDASRSREGG